MILLFRFVYINLDYNKKLFNNEVNSGGMALRVEGNCDVENLYADKPKKKKTGGY